MDQSALGIGIWCDCTKFGPHRLYCRSEVAHALFVRHIYLLTPTSLLAGERDFTLARLWIRSEIFVPLDW